MHSERMRRWRLLVELASRDLWFDHKISLCIVASLIAVITPLLLLFGLKHGVVSQMREKLLSDPHNLEIRMLGNGNYDQRWFDALTAQPSAGFVIPLTRSLNTQADLVHGQHFAADAEIIPSGAGDPLLQGRIAPPHADSEVVLSAAAAKRLAVATGDRIQVVVQRKRDGVFERGQLGATVTGVLDATVFPRPAALVTLDLLVAMEDFRDGYRVRLFGPDGTSPPGSRTHFARARIYARTLDDVAPLADWLQKGALEVSTRAREIDAVKAIDRVLSLIFAVIAWTAVLGCVASLIGAFLANIDRKRKDLAVLRLLGFRRAAVGAYVMVQAALLTGIAFALGYGAYLLGSAVFNRALGVNLAEGAFVCKLEPAHIALGCASALFIAILVSGIGGFRAIRIQPAESLREA